MHIPPDRPGNLYKQRRQISNFLGEMIKSKFHQELKTFKNTLNYLIINNTETANRGKNKR